MTLLCKTIPRWLAQTYIEGIPYGFLTFLHIFWAQALMTFVLDYLFKYFL